MEYEIVLAAAAEKGLDAVPRKVRVRIVDALDKLRGDPRPRGSVKLKGTDDLAPTSRAIPHYLHDSGRRTPGAGRSRGAPKRQLQRVLKAGLYLRTEAEGRVTRRAKFVRPDSLTRSSIASLGSTKQWCQACSPKERSSGHEELG
jgi:hypothetical protein